jgi:membrane-associated phospholipid phosphatase
MVATVYKEKAQLLRHTIVVLVLGAFLMTIGFFWLDQRIVSFFKHPEQETIYYYSREITNIGYAIHYLALSLVLLIITRFFSKHIGYLNQNTRARLLVEQWSLFSIKVLLAAGVVVQIIKPLIGRRRPHVADDSEILFNRFTTDSHWHSFPSGHTQVLLTVATILSLIWPKGRWYFFALGLMLAFTRVSINQHYFSDYIGGILVGYLVTLWVFFKWPPRI